MASLLDKIREEFLDTLRCYDEGWSGLRWRDYTLEHTERVKKLAIDIGKKEGLNGRQLFELEVAAQLHDIAKGLEGDIIRDERGDVIKDKDGLYRCHLVIPSNQNWLISDYLSNVNPQSMGFLHSGAGAYMAKLLLNKYGLGQEAIANIAYLIENHIDIPAKLKEPKKELLIIVDADTIDAHFGLHAIYRGALHKLRQFMERDGENFRGFESYADGYFRHMFVEGEDLLGSPRKPTIYRVCQIINTRIRTQSGKEVAQSGYEQMLWFGNKLGEEVEKRARDGLRDMVIYFMMQHKNPNLARDIRAVAQMYSRNNDVITFCNAVGNLNDRHFL